MTSFNAVVSSNAFILVFHSPFCSKKKLNQKEKAVERLNAFVFFETMPIPADQIKEGTKCSFTGTLQVGASGLAGTGRHLVCEEVTIHRVLPGYAYPVCIEKGGIRLGWVHPDDLDELRH